MRTDSSPIQNAFSNILLPGTILLANVDYTGLLAYGLRALVGGAIWLGFKCTADYLEYKRQRASHPTKSQSTPAKRRRYGRTR